MILPTHSGGLEIIMREIEERQPQQRMPHRRMKHPGRFVVFLITSFICIWMIINFIIALATGQRFSMLGCSSQPVRNVIVAGVDEGGYRTDLLMLCQIDRRSGELNVLQIPRDTKVQNRRNDKKINSAYYSGYECLRNEVEQVTGLVADDYIMLGFDGFTDVIDALGGVRIDVPIRMYYTDPVQDLTIDLEAGKQRLDGKEAQMFMRFRQNNDGTGYVNGDVDRIEAQKTLYTAAAKKLISPVGWLRAPAVFSALKRNCETNMGGGELLGVMRDIAATIGNAEFHSLPGGGRYIGGGSYFVYDARATEALIAENFVVE